MPVFIFVKKLAADIGFLKTSDVCRKKQTACTSPHTTTHLPQVNITTFTTERMAMRGCFTATTTTPFFLGDIYISLRPLQKLIVIA